MSINRLGTDIDNPEKLEKQRTALLLVETHRGAGHMNVISKLSNELSSRGFKVVIATGSMDVGANFDYGNALIEELDRLSFHPEKPFAEHNGYEFRFPNNRTLRRHLNSIHFDEDQSGLRVIIQPKKLQSKFFEQNDFHIEKPQFILLDYLKSLKPKNSLDQTKHPSLLTIQNSFKEEIETWKSIINEALCTRQKVMRTIVEEHEPDLVLTEFWPCGRTKSNVELIPLLEFVKERLPDCLVLSLERDITHAKPEYSEKVIETLNTLFDGVLVRGDKNFYSFSESMPEIVSKSLVPFAEVGLFADKPVKKEGIPPKVLISAGGGWRDGTDQRFYEYAIRAAVRSSHDDLVNKPIQVLVPPNAPEDDFIEIQEFAMRCANGRTISVDRNFPSDKFEAYLAVSPMVVSQGGANVMNSIYIHRRNAVSIPAQDIRNGDWNEQDIRTRRFESMGLLSVMDLNSAANPDRLASVIDKSAERKWHDHKNRLIMNGAERASLFIDLLLNRKIQFKDSFDIKIAFEEISALLNTATTDAYSNQEVSNQEVSNQEVSNDGISNDGVSNDGDQVQGVIERIIQRTNSVPFQVGVTASNYNVPDSANNNDQYSDE